MRDRGHWALMYRAVCLFTSFTGTYCVVCPRTDGLAISTVTVAIVTVSQKKIPDIVDLPETDSG